MGQTATQLDPAVLREVHEAGANIQLAAATPAQPNFRLVYYAVPGCGEMHNYRSLQTAGQLPGVRLNYINVFNPTQNFAGAPGARLLANPLTGQRLNTVADVIGKFGVPYHMEISEAPHVLLLNREGRVIREFNSSTDRNFVSEVARLTGNQQQVRGATRG